MTMDIPKIIWQTHNYEFEDLPDHFKKTAQTWKNLNPGWDYRYVSHTEREKTIKKNSIFWKYYHTQRPICQADMWRYLVTYEYGGVWADMDSICVKPIDYLLESVIHNSKDYEIFVVPQFHWWTYMEDRVKRLKDKGYSSKEIKERIDFQTNRSGLQVYQLEALNMVHGYSTNNANYAITAKSKIMENIIQESEKHLIKKIQKNKTYTNYTNLLNPFLDIVQGSKDNLIKPSKKTSFGFTVAHHDDLYKNDFDPNFFVDDYGNMIKYEEYLTKYNLSM